MRHQHKWQDLRFSSILQTLPAGLSSLSKCIQGPWLPISCHQITVVSCLTTFSQSWSMQTENIPQELQLVEILWHSCPAIKIWPLLKSLKNFKNLPFFFNIYNTFTYEATTENLAVYLFIGSPYSCAMSHHSYRNKSLCQLCKCTAIHIIWTKSGVLQS